MKDVSPVEPPTLTPAALDDLDLPEDFDLSLADEPDAPAAKPDAFASELDDVNAELDRLSRAWKTRRSSRPSPPKMRRWAVTNRRSTSSPAPMRSQPSWIWPRPIST